MDNLIKNKYLFTLTHLGFKATLQLSFARLWSTDYFYLLKRHLSSLPTDHRTRAAISVEKITPGDAKEIVRSIASLETDSKKEVISRLLFYEAGFKNCYIAKTASNEIACLQWLVYPSENYIIQKYFARTFYELNDDQVMIENAFAFPKFRGLGLLPYMTTKLLSIARDSGYKSVVAYIRKDRITPLNEFVKSGFKITKIIKEYKFLGATRRAL